MNNQNLYKNSDFTKKSLLYMGLSFLFMERVSGRIYGEDGYGDEYLVLLTADTVREMAFSAWCEIRNAEITAAREKAVGA